jgi:hypothetical protein
LSQLSKTKHRAFNKLGEWQMWCGVGVGETDGGRVKKRITGNREDK